MGGRGWQLQTTVLVSALMIMRRSGSDIGEQRRRMTLTARGRGLGLAVVRQVAEAHGGTVRVDSQHGNGARFWIWIPRDRSTRGNPPVLIPLM